MIKRLLKGLLAGFLLGLLYGWADTLNVFMMVKAVMDLLWDPFNATTLELFTLDTAWVTIAGGVMGLIGLDFHKRPLWFLHGIVATLFALCFVVSPEIDGILALAMGSVLLFHILALIMLRLYFRHRSYLYLAVPLFPIVWYVVLSRGLIPADYGPADPNRPKPQASAPNILWVVFDTTRQDHLSVYGHSRKTTPNLEKIAADGAVFDRAYSTAPWTLASHASMFTGLYSAQHWCNHEHLFLDKRNETLATILTDAGYDTAVFAGNPWLDHSVGLVRGFGLLQSSWHSYSISNIFAIGRLRIMTMEGGQDKGAAESNRSFARFLEANEKSGRPFFAFINYLEAHSPYDHIPDEDLVRFLPPGTEVSEARRIARKFQSRMMFATDYVATPQEKEIALAMYDGGIYNADRRLGEVIEMLRKKGELDNTVIIMNADHGEMFGEHEIYGHDFALYDALVHVPLVMRYPGKVPSGVRIDKPVQLIDVFSTILEYTGQTAAADPHVRGQSLTTIFNGGGDPERPVFNEYFTTEMRPLVREIRKMGYDPKTFRLKAAQIRDLRLIRFPDKEVVFDISVDPGEEKDLSQERPEDLQRLRAALEQFMRENPHAHAAPDSPVHEVNPPSKEQLESLNLPK